ncbi:MAG TPA: HAMP domain-containing sensor histidine kinase [Arsenicitalea sp.]|jgi:two-component system sensor histidine kinase RegB|nr:HAMP domain-containing sensor histidine kinase [Arsenicitalea sp.]
MTGTSSPRPAPAPPLVGDTSGRKNMLLLIQLRWMAVAGQIVTIAGVQLGMGIDLPLRSMSVVLAALVTLNLVTIWWLQGRPDVDNRWLFLALLLDVVALTAQLYLSGGATNPFIFLYLLQVTLAAVLLDTWSTTGIVALTCACFVGLTIFNRPIALPRAGMPDPFTLHIAGTLVCFALDAALLFVFVGRITRNLRARDAHVAALRQRAVEEDHIVRMGLLASGAAHELGSPLSSLSVILGDWRRMPVLSGDPELLQEIAEMQAAVQRCKSILTGVLMSAGEARGEAPVVTTVNAFLNDLVDDWRVSRAASILRYDNRFGENLSIVSDSALKQVVFNVLDNALEASPRRVDFVIERDDATLLLIVSDTGPGFKAEMLARFGKPYQSSKGRAGGGLGLFLVVNVVRKLGGMVSARNRPEGGAVVTIELPLETLMIGTPPHAG